MINTVATKQEQLRDGFFKRGSGPKNILIIGSCRSISYVNYFVDLNQSNEYSIHFIDPFYWNWNSSEERVDLKKSLNECENNSNLMSMIRGSHWFIHENYESYEIFNTNPNREKNIFQTGIKPEVEITVPNYDNLFILFMDVLSEHKELKSEAVTEIGTMGGISLNLQRRIAIRGLQDVEKFCRTCELFSSFPEMASQFRNNWNKVRYFWTMNHVTSNFTAEIFKILSRMLGLSVSEILLEKWRSEDVLSGHSTPVTNYDVENFGIEWNCPVMELSII